METLQQEIEVRVDVMVQDIMTMVRRVAVTAMTNALAAGAMKEKEKQARKVEGRGESRKVGPKRSKAEIADLRERLYAAMCEQPGESMLYFAGQLNVRTPSLALPARQLYEQERVRKVGERNHTRYFPMVQKEASVEH